MGLKPKRFMVISVPREAFDRGFTDADVTFGKGPATEKEAEATARILTRDDGLGGVDDLNLVLEIKSVHEIDRAVVRRSL